MVHSGKKGNSFITSQGGNPRSKHGTIIRENPLNFGNIAEILLYII